MRATSPALATRFVVAEGKVAELERHDTLDAALAAAGLEPGDRAETGPPEQARERSGPDA